MRKRIPRRRAIYAFEFPDKSVYIGLTCDYSSRYKAHLRDNKTIIKKTNELGHTFIQFNEWMDEKQAAKIEQNTIDKYASKGWIILNKNKAGALGSNLFKWTPDKIIDEAKKYKNIGEFNKNNSSAYNAARKFGLVDVIKKNMTKLRKEDGYWTEERILNEAKKYNSPKEFQEGNNSAYAYCLRLNLKEKAYSHMSKQRVPRKWTFERILIEVKHASSRTKLYKQHKGIHRAITNLAVEQQAQLNEILPAKINPNGYWSERRIRDLAKKCKSKQEFRTKYGAGRAAAMDLGIWDSLVFCALS